MPRFSGRRLIWLSLQNNRPIFSHSQTSSGRLLNLFRSTFKLVNKRRFPNDKGNSDKRFSVKISSVNWLHCPIDAVNTTNWFCSNLSIDKLASWPIELGKYSIVFCARFMSVSDTQPCISSGSVSSMFSLTSRYCRRFSLPISRGIVFTWLRSSQRTLRFWSLPISGGISSISLLPRSSDSSLAMLHREFGMDFNRLSLPWSERKLTRLSVKRDVVS